MSLLSVSEDSLCPSFKKPKHNTDNCFSKSDINGLYLTDINSLRNSNVPR